MILSWGSRAHFNSVGKGGNTIEKIKAVRQQYRAQLEIINKILFRAFFSIVLFPPFPTEFRSVSSYPKTKSLTLYKMAVAGSVRNVFVTER